MNSINRKKVLGLILGFSLGCSSAQRGENAFWNEGNPIMEVKELFPTERFPNVVTAKDGSIVATWGNQSYQVRRSEDGGKTWSSITTLAKPGFQGGGVTVDEESGDILAFVEDSHPIAPVTLYRSSDQGRTWNAEKTTILPDSLGNIPSMHMNEHGITLRFGDKKGRLIRPTRYYGGGNDREYWETHYTNAIYSDDGGRTWQTSAPFPAKGTGEAAIAELSDGTLYYNSRRHLSTDGLNPRMRYIARSRDGGHTWEELSVSEVLPDGDQSRDYGLMAGLVRLPIAGHDILLFSNIESPEGRTHGTVWASFDGGETWPVKKLVEPGGFAYSSLTAGRAGTPSEGLVFLLYEGSGHPSTVGKIAVFNLAWLTDGKDWRAFLPKR
ncbi:sialidase family protein [Cyclobacterium xiamenense]|uniref:sialidase family protein n=1 Tax=Cyclobacterium xiamenense TaxID=1297121 RepID=UPI0012B9D5F2|nr:sialidase family protein [Cyclobacterium xiamenense]